MALITVTMLFQKSSRKPVPSSIPLVFWWQRCIPTETVTKKSENKTIMDFNAIFVIQMRAKYAFNFAFCTAWFSSISLSFHPYQPWLQGDLEDQADLDLSETKEKENLWTHWVNQDCAILRVAIQRRTKMAEITCQFWSSVLIWVNDLIFLNVRVSR